MALGISRRDRGAVRDGLFALLRGFLAAIAVTLLFGLAVRGAGEAPARSWPASARSSDLINTPDVFSPVVAVLAGGVGMVSLTEARANALIGVFISVTTIPAAASVGVSIAFSSGSEAWGSALQLLLNVVVLIVVGAVGLSAQRRIWRWRMGRPPGPLRPEGRPGHEHVLAGFDDAHLPGTLAIRPACAAAPMSAQVRWRAGRPVGRALCTRLPGLAAIWTAVGGLMRSTRELGAGRPSNARAGPRPEARGTLRTLLRVGAISGLLTGRRSLCGTVSIRHAEAKF